MVSTTSAIVGGRSFLQFCICYLQAALAHFKTTFSGETTLKAVLFGLAAILVFLVVDRAVTGPLILLPRILFLSLGSNFGSCLAGTTNECLSRRYLFGLMTLVGLPRTLLASLSPLLRSFLRSDLSMDASVGSFF